MITYKEFLNLGGDKEIPQDFFDANVDGYSELINYYTFYRIDFENEELNKKFKYCLKELIQNSYRNKIDEDSVKTINKGIKSESVGKHSINYIDSDEYNNKNSLIDKLNYKIIKKYFGLTGLMYRGVY